MHNGITPLHTFKSGTLTSKWYCAVNIQHSVSFFPAAVVPNFLLIDDNARPHRIAEVYNTLAVKDIEHMSWAAYSAHLNHLEHV